MEGLEKQYFQIISAIGMTRSSYIETIQEARKANFERARGMIEEENRSFLQGREAHAKMIQQEVGGGGVETGLLLIRAEGQLMSAESFKIIADGMIQNYERIIALKSKIKQSRKENDMKKVCLFCSADMSTSVLAQETQNVADVHGLPLEVKAYSHLKTDDIVEQLHPGCILLEPQVKYLHEETNRRFKEAVPVAVIDASDYGMINGEGVLKTAIKPTKLLKK